MGTSPQNATRYNPDSSLLFLVQMVTLVCTKMKSNNNRSKAMRQVYGLMIYQNNYAAGTHPRTPLGKIKALAIFPGFDEAASRWGGNKKDTKGGEKKRKRGEGWE